MIAVHAMPSLPLTLGGDAARFFSYGFMRNAMLAGTALSVVCGMVGYFLVLRHEAFAGEALSDVAFTGALGGAVLGIGPLPGMLGATLIGAAATAAFGTRLRDRDIATGTVLAWVLGLGALFLTLFAAHGGNGTGTSGVSILFGSILSISESQAWVLAILGAAIVVILLGISRPLFFASIDPDVAAARGVPVRILGVAYMLLLGVTVVEAVQAVGALLVFALLLLPAATAYELSSRRLTGMALAVALTVLATWVGLVGGFYSGLPISVCISLFAFAMYAGVTGVRRLRDLRASREALSTTAR